MSKNFDIKDNKILQDKVNESYARHIAFKYLLKASKVLKNNDFNNYDRKSFLKIMSRHANDFIGYITSEDYTFNTFEIQQLITVCMEILFQRMVLLDKSGIKKDYWNGCLSALIMGIYEITFAYIKSHDGLDKTYSYIKHYSSIGYNAALREAAESGYITKGQYNGAHVKTYINYLNKEIADLMGIKKDPNKSVKSALIFLICLFVLNFILYFLKMHS